MSISITKFLGISIIALSLLGCESDSSSTNTERKTPQGAWWDKETLLFPTTPSGFTAVLGWMQATTLESNVAPNDDKVEIAWTRLIERDADGVERVVSETRYNDANSRFGCDGVTYCDGGLFTRFPRWFATNDFVPLAGARIENGLLIIPAGAHPEKIAHWWTPRVVAKPGARYFVEFSLRVTGKIAFQAGSDYWRTMDSQFNINDGACQKSNNCEAWISDWLGDTKGAFVTFRAPRH